MAEVQEAFEQQSHKTHELQSKLEPSSRTEDTILAKEQVVDDNNASGENNKTTAGTPALVIRVNEPAHISIGLTTKVTTYLIETENYFANNNNNNNNNNTSNSNMEDVATIFRVRRKDSDFEVLQRRLVEERTGIIVPVVGSLQSVPRKQRFSEEFLFDRMKSLQQFLNTVARHPELSDTACLELFLTEEDEEWGTTSIISPSLANRREPPFVDEQQRQQLQFKIDQKLHNNKNDDNKAEYQDELDSPTGIFKDSPFKMRKQQQLDLSARHTQQPSSSWGKWMNQARTNWALRNKNLHLEEVNDEQSKKFVEYQTYADHLEMCLQILSQDMKSYLDAIFKQSEASLTIGAAMSQLCKGEQDELLSTNAAASTNNAINSKNSSMFMTIGHCWTNISKLQTTQQQQAKQQVETAMQQLQHDVKALQEALLKRKEIVYQHTKLVDRMKGLQQQMDKLRLLQGKDFNNEKYYQLEQEIMTFHPIVQKSQSHVQIISDRLERDLTERFRKQFCQKMGSIFQAFHQIQYDYTSKHAQTWEQSIPMLSLSLSALNNSSSSNNNNKNETEPQMIYSVSTTGVKVAFVGGNNNEDNDTTTASSDTTTATNATVSTSASVTTNVDDGDNDNPVGNDADCNKNNNDNDDKEDEKGNAANDDNNKSAAADDNDADATNNENDAKTDPATDNNDQSNDKKDEEKDQNQKKGKQSPPRQRSPKSPLQHKTASPRPPPPQPKSAATTITNKPHPTPTQTAANKRLSKQQTNKTTPATNRTRPSPPPTPPNTRQVKKTPPPPGRTTNTTKTTTTPIKRKSNKTVQSRYLSTTNTSKTAVKPVVKKKVAGRTAF